VIHHKELSKNERLRSEEESWKEKLT